MTGLARATKSLVLAFGLLLTPAAHAVDTISIGLVGSTGPTHWPIHIGVKKGYYAAENIKLDLVFIQSSGAVLQQLAAGSLDTVLSAGLTDPINAIDKGAPIALVRLEMQLAPYAINAKAQHKKFEDLKGKIVMVDAPKGITSMYLARMLAAHNMKLDDVDRVFAGATAARFQALQSGAIDATILLPPFSFQAEAAGYSNLGLVADFAKDLPFTGAAVNKNWAGKNPDLVRRFLGVHNKSVGWFLDKNNRQEAIDIMVEASKLKPDVIAQTFDFLHSRPFIEGSGRVSKTKIGTLLTALKAQGDLAGSTDVERFVLPGVGQLSD
jgi:ABC-type nitrate/sulfonate/bicarbonate transport system substrate-binding protein